jgi:glycosyltransferase involved in cell wall biosynthesis
VPLRLLHVSQPVEAGVPEVVSALVADQFARGHEVHVACPPGPGLAERVRSLGALQHPWRAERSPGASVPGEVRRLRRIVARIQPDVVVLHSAKAGLAGRLAVRGAVPTIYVPHAWSFEAVRGRTAAACTAWEAFAGRWTDAIVCVSADEADRGRAAGITARMEIVANGVDVEALQPSDQGKARARLGLPVVPTVVCVGRLAEQKGQDLLLRAWPAVAAAVPGARLVLVGDGPERAALERSAPDGVLFAGSRDDVADWLAAADVVALPSRWESTPLISLEAMAMGRPVVAFEVDGVRAAFGDTGVVLAQGDVAGMAGALTRLLEAPEAAKAAGDAARTRAEQVADRRRTLRAWDDVVRSVSGHATGGPALTGLRMSVVVTVLNEGPALARLVDALLPQLRNGDEIVIVDGGSTDGSVTALPEHPAVRVEVVPGAGISAGRNNGVLVAANEVIVCTDAGCTPAPDFLDAFRRAFAVPEPPAMVSGVYEVLARTAMERAQALACYPQPDEVRRPSRFVRAYTRLFGTGFDPRFAVGRCVAFTREAWKAVGGFPEHLATGEDVSFGLAISRIGAVRTAPDAVVGWTQREGIAATWRMYRGYGRSSTGGGDRALLVRDGVRGLAYVAAPLLALHPAGRRLVAAGALAYLSLPVARAVKARSGPATFAALPLALATKDLGKLAGALHGLSRRSVR